MFFAYHPLRWRLLLAFVAACTVVVAAWAAAGLVATEGGVLEAARLGLSVGLLAALMVIRYRLRPRDGWGVQVTAEGVIISRVFEGHMQVPWSEVSAVKLTGPDKQALGVFLHEENQRLLVPRHLFARKSDFESCLRGLQEGHQRTQGMPVSVLTCVSRG